MSTTQKPVSPPIAPPPNVAAATLAAPSRASQCIVDAEKDGSLTVTFTIPPEVSRRFDLERCGRDMAEFLWEVRGLKHFERQRLT